jgi:hypothetical protein
MRMVIAGLAASLALAPGGLVAESLVDEIQDEEQPGSQIEMEIGGGGGVEIGREGDMTPPSPVEVEGEVLDVPAGPDDPEDIDPTDDELPGEGPEDLSGPDDGDPLPD